MSTPNPLTREQKLMAEQVVQLGNIAEAIRAAASGQDSSDLMNQVQQLRAELAELTQQRAELTTALAESNTKVAELQASLASLHEGDVTPDSINEVMSHLDIDYQ